MPIVINIHINIQIATPVMIDFGIDQKQRFLTKSNRIMFGIKRRRHTESEHASLSSSDYQYFCGPFVSCVDVESGLSVSVEK
jgi:hypothetical protein